MSAVGAGTVAGTASGAAVVEASDAGLLGNMSSRPRTEIRRVVPPVQRGWVVFDLLRSSTGDEPDVITPEHHARLEERWQALGLTGATLVHPHRHVLPGAGVPLACRDLDLTLNVLLRVRGNLLIHGMPKLERRDPTTSSAVVCADPRLHAIVVAANAAVARARRRARAAEVRQQKASAEGSRT
jgi:hypothetical protein